MRMRDDARMWPALALASLLFATGCQPEPVPGNDTGVMSTTTAAMTADPMAPAGSCTDGGTADTIPCMGLDSGTVITFKVEPASDSGSTSTVPYAALLAECGDSGSTSTVPCTVFVKKK